MCSGELAGAQVPRETENVAVSPCVLLFLLSGSLWISFDWVLNCCCVDRTQNSSPRSKTDGPSIVRLTGWARGGEEHDLLLSWDSTQAEAGFSRTLRGQSAHSKSCQNTVEGSNTSQVNLAIWDYDYLCVCLKSHASLGFC